jgi:hypothetical protein
VWLLFLASAFHGAAANDVSYHGAFEFVGAQIHMKKGGYSSPTELTAEVTTTVDTPPSILCQGSYSWRSMVG